MAKDGRPPKQSGEIVENDTATDHQDIDKYHDFTYWCWQEFQSSALVTLGVPFGDVAMLLFVSWLCIDWLLATNKHLGGTMMKIFEEALKTGLNTLAALRGHGNDRVTHQAAY